MARAPSFHVHRPRMAYMPTASHCGLGCNHAASTCRHGQVGLARPSTWILNEHPSTAGVEKRCLTEEGVGGGDQGPLAGREEAALGVVVGAFLAGSAVDEVEGVLQGRHGTAGLAPDRLAGNRTDQQGTRARGGWLRGLGQWVCHRPRHAPGGGRRVGRTGRTA